MSGTELPENWRERLPDPALFYEHQIESLTTPDATGWATGVCPFHSDRNTTLFVCLAGAHSGSWRCGGECGGGDMVGFQMKLYSLSYRSSVLYLLGFDRAISAMERAR
jgi:DNA primase